MNYGYQPSPPDRLIELIKELKQEAIDDYDCKNDEEIADVIISELAKARRYNHFYRALINKAVIKLCPAMTKSPTFHHINKEVLESEKQLSNDEKQNIKILISSI